MKRLVICCDGTWNSADQEVDGVPCPTNVLKTAFRVAKRADRVPQIVFYDQGVGTGNSIDRLTGGAFGDGLLDNILDAYRFLTANYEPGDEIYCFGFSRGAYTVRSLVGMVRKCGILARTSVSRYKDAIELYCSPDSPNADAPTAFRTQHCVVGPETIPVEFLGVWDTVGSLGIPLRGMRWMTRRKHQFHDVELSGSVANAFHALAIDERRAPFEATRWTPKAKPGQRVKQVWFCGVHSDVGGGYPESGLSDVSLQWMLDNAVASGLVLDAAVEQRYPLKPDALQPLHDSKTGLYRLTSGIDRSIGTAAQSKEQPGANATAADPTQSLHPTVLERWDRDRSYRPRNLVDYFKRTGDPRGQNE
ncbi:MAG: DUF2235 domain-containing protein [Pseudomonadota bacterium]|jgi:uncharacterized protein (DUF2235 family)